MTVYTIETITAAQALAFSASDVLRFTNSGTNAALTYAIPAGNWSSGGLSPGAKVLLLGVGMGQNVQFGAGLLGAGASTILFPDNSVLFIGGPGADVATGGAQNDHLEGDAGDDVLSGGAGDDVLAGWDGNDILEGGAGNDDIGGGAGIDTATYANASGAVAIDLVHGLMSGAAGVDRIGGVENLIGSAFNDSLTGDDFNNLLVGGAGDDFLQGWSYAT